MVKKVDNIGMRIKKIFPLSKDSVEVEKLNIIQANISSIILMLRVLEEDMRDAVIEREEVINSILTKNDYERGPFETVYYLPQSNRLVIRELKKEDIGV
ncbi:hypothetical protein M0R04_05940 [Candidatus Dojkabacteria bacterium]|jgi:hypothetical protein|nr:hypothetical protein [Candidatus Dojkabacteria bacterium]